MKKFQAIFFLRVTNRLRMAKRKIISKNRSRDRTELFPTLEYYKHFVFSY
jgi:hypothetical protein